MTEVLVIRRRRKRKGGRPRKPAAFRHVAMVSARLTRAEAIVLERVIAARDAQGLPGTKNPTEWIRASLHEQALTYGVDLPEQYTAVRLLRDELPSRPEPPPPEDERPGRGRPRRA